jgi:hypothetical protein
VEEEICSKEPADFGDNPQPIAVTPIGTWSRVTAHALRFAYTVSHEVRAVHVSAGEDTDNAVCSGWAAFAEAPALKMGLPPPRLVILDSPYRWVLTPILNYVLEVEKENPGRQIAVILPEMVERHWYHYLLHNQRAEVLKTWLLLKGNGRIVLINVPWYLKD